MSADTGEKTEEPSQRKLEEAQRKGQFARSQEVQTAFVLLGGLTGLYFTGQSLWNDMATLMSMSLGHLHDTPVSPAELSGYGASGVVWFTKNVGPIVVGVVGAALLAGTLQNRFTLSSEVMGLKWERLDVMSGLQRVFSGRSAVPTLIACAKLGLIVALTWSQIQSVLSDPIFFTAVSLDRMASFLTGAAWSIALRVILVVGLMAAADYGYQWWRNHRDLMMTKEEVKDEMKNSEGNPRIKAARRRRRAASQRKMLADVPKADVVLVNPTHIAVALHYDRRTMKAPVIVAKGIRLNAKRIREIAEAHQIPILENKPLARLMFKYGRVGGEIPAQLYAAVAEVLAWVYRVNRYRYHAAGNAVTAS